MGGKTFTRYQEMNALKWTAELYNGEKIKEILIKTHQSKDNDRFIKLLNNFKSAKTFYEKVNALKEMEKLK